MPLKFIVENFKEHMKNFPEDLVKQETYQKLKMVDQNVGEVDSNMMRTLKIPREIQ